MPMIGPMDVHDIKIELHSILFDAPIQMIQIDVLEKSIIAYTTVKMNIRLHTL